MASQDHGMHSFMECVLEESDYLQQTLGRVHTIRILTHNKRREDGSNWRSSSHHLNKIPQAMRNTKNTTLEEHLIHLSIWIRKDAIMNEEDDEAEGSRRSLPAKKINISIQLSFHDIVFVMNLFIFSWCIMHDRMFALMAEPSSHEEITKKKGKTSSRRMMSTMQYWYWTEVCSSIIQ